MLKAIIDSFVYFRRLDYAVQMVRFLESVLCTLVLAELLWFGWRFEVIRVSSPWLPMFFLCAPGLVVVGIYLREVGRIVAGSIKFRQAFGVVFSDRSAERKVIEILTQRAADIQSGVGSRNYRRRKREWHDLRGIAVGCGIELYGLGWFIAQAEKQSQ